MKTEPASYREIAIQALIEHSYLVNLIFFVLFFPGFLVSIATVYHIHIAPVDLLIQYEQEKGVVLAKEVIHPILYVNVVLYGAISLISLRDLIFFRGD